MCGIQVLPVTSTLGVFYEPFMLCVCAGHAHPADIVQAGRVEQVRVVPVDILRGGHDHDLCRPEVQAELVRLCRSGIVASAHFATDCRTFSPLNEDVGFRVPPDADGAFAPQAFRRYIDQQNAMIVLCVTLATILLGSARPVSWENPPRLDEVGTDWHWPEMAQRVSSLWQTSWVCCLEASFPVARVTASMCMFGSVYRKYFSLLMSCQFASFTRTLSAMRCPGVGAHACHPPARGVDAEGNFHSERAGDIPGHCVCSWCACTQRRKHRT